MIYQGGDTKKDPWHTAEMRRLISEFGRWRIWNWSVWAAIAGCALFAALWTLSLFSQGDPSPSATLVGLRLAPALVALPLAALQQYLFSRFTLPPLFRAFGALGALLVFACTLFVTDHLLQVSNRLLKERVTFHCLSGERGLPCRKLMRANPGALALFDGEQQLMIRLHSDPTRRVFDELDENHQKIVNEAYGQIIDAYERHDFYVMNEQAHRILTYVDEFKDTRSYESISMKGLEGLAEESKRRAREVRQEILHGQVAALEEDGDKLLPRAHRNRAARRQLDGLIVDIFTKDPNNRKAAEWKQQLSQWDAKSGRGVASVRAR